MPNFLRILSKTKQFKSEFKFIRFVPGGQEKGFTIIELLVVLAVFVTLSTIVLSILITVLRGAKKSDSIIVARQNGQQAIDQTVKSLRFAQSLDYPSPLGGANPACSSSGVTVSQVRVTSVNLIQTTVSCPSSSSYPNYIDLNGVSLTNKETVVVKSCRFVCSQQSGGPPVIRFTFDLAKRNTSGLTEENTTIPFQTSIELRNITSN